MSFFENEDGRKCIIIEYNVLGEVIWEDQQLGLFKVRYDRGGYGINISGIFKKFEVELDEGIIIE